MAAPAATTAAPGAASGAGGAWPSTALADAWRKDCVDAARRAAAPVPAAAGGRPPPPPGPRLKLVLLGSSSAGKTCLHHRFFEGEWRDSHFSTVGVDFMQRAVDAPCDGRDSKVCLQVWDMAGSEKFFLTSSAYVRGAHSALVVVSFVNRDTLRVARRWLDYVRTDPGTPITMLANACELPVEERAFAAEEARALAAEYGVPSLRFRRRRATASRPPSWAARSTLCACSTPPLPG